MQNAPPPPIVCQLPAGAPAGALGVYWTSGRTIMLAPDVCARLDLLRAGRRPRNVFVQRDLAEAVWLLGHEQAHADGVPELYPAPDVGADCAGLRHFNRVASALGVGWSYATLLRGYVEAALFAECGND